jgi:hypothetical protein
VNPIGTESLPLFGSPESRENLDQLRPERWTALKRAVLALYGDMRARIPDEAAYEIGRDYMAIRPRCSELHTEGLLVFTGQKRRARMGRGTELKITERGLEVLRRLNAKPCPEY